MKKHKDHGIGHRTSSSPPRKKNLCFGCGRDNPAGMRLKFALDETAKQFVCRFRLGKRYTGPPGYCHGGVIATILDEAMAKMNRLFDAPAPTSRMTVEYLRPVPLNRALEVRSKNVSKRGRRLTHSAEIRDEKGTVLARSRGVFVIIGHKHVFRSAR
ncbi:MAG TPA: PaaI family thioesterase [Terriglobales bacterium]|jgi:uncharacterized protein (TIGR00369 family)|nr:PaaI family thioesterase [Terriglobales bacterium]